MSGFDSELLAIEKARDYLHRKVGLRLRWFIEAVHFQIRRYRRWIETSILILECTEPSSYNFEPFDKNVTTAASEPTPKLKLADLRRVIEILEEQNRKYKAAVTKTLVESYDEKFTAIKFKPRKYEGGIFPGTGLTS